ncbi:MAG: Rrf2 family transcriptional regulator [Pseudomonadota bacterium]
MHVSREMDYGVRAMLVLAAHEGDVVSKRTIATEYCIPVNFLALILPKLVHEGFIESLPGPKGGYRLAKPSAKISLYDVACAVDEEFKLSHCLDPKKGCEMSKKCPVSSVWQKLQQECISLLKQVTFDSLAKQYKA